MVFSVGCRSAQDQSQNLLNLIGSFVVALFVHKQKLCQKSPKGICLSKDLAGGGHALLACVF